MLPPEERLVGAQLARYIGDKLYWVLHSPRQTGKTTFLQSWMREINAPRNGADGSEPIACYVSLESCQGITDPERAMHNIYRSICDFATLFEIPVPQVEETDIESLRAVPQGAACSDPPDYKDRWY
ncbi:hypothetical protein FACS1894109_21130 [Spirochaetia bacterium]|nr:hypothetical protein FACS1894109_21130 [Spirochaetia bacterium]